MKVRVLVACSGAMGLCPDEATAETWAPVREDEDTGFVRLGFAEVPDGWSEAGGFPPDFMRCPACTTRKRGPT